MLELTFLSADRPLSKSFSRAADGRLTKTAYPFTLNFTSHSVAVPNLASMALALEAHAADGHCLLKGNTTRDLVNEPRAGSTDANAPTPWLCLDIDRTPKNVTPADVLDALGISNASYIVQYSASYLLEPERGLCCHIFLHLASPVSPAQLKNWLMQKNLSVPMFSESLALTKTDMALLWPLDITTCQNDKLLYIAPPELEEDIDDPVARRIEYVERSTEYAMLSLELLPSLEMLRKEINTRINALRTLKGLPQRKFTTKTDKSTGLEVLSKCDQATLTGLKAERGFVYMNLNGGDSWGYWHPEDNPAVIRNFKGEPNYLTAELLPEYWAELQKPKVEAADPERPRVLAFRDFHTALYYNGIWDPERQRLDLAVAKSEKQVNDYLKFHGQPEVDPIPVWRVSFDPHSDVRVDFDRKAVNMWAPTKFMFEQPPGEWPTIERVIHHAVAHNEAIYEHFLNWLACAWTMRVPMLTAWVLHGVQGTGKGVLVQHVLAPLFGRQYVAIKRMEELEDQFNTYMEQALLVVIDEAQISDSRRSKMIMANLKNQITEPTITVRRMRTAAQSIPNYTNWLFLSNMPDPVSIDASDRRFNVGEFREERLYLKDDDIRAIESELPGFAHYLATRTADFDRARLVMQSDERERIIATSRTSVELVAEALQKGMLELFWEELPSGDVDLLPIQQQMLWQNYQKLVHECVNGKDKLTRDELRVMFEYLCGDMPRTPTKFTQLLRHRNLHIKPMWVGNKTVRGLAVDWKVDNDWLQARREEVAK